MTTSPLPAFATIDRSWVDEFPILADRTYFNSCSARRALRNSCAPRTRSTSTARDANGAEWEHWVERAETMRAEFAGLLGAESDEVAVTTSVSQGVAGIISALPFERSGRTKIVISEHEFPTVGQIAHAQALRGAEIVQVRADPRTAQFHSSGSPTWWTSRRRSSVARRDLHIGPATATTSARSRAWRTSRAHSYWPTVTRR